MDKELTFYPAAGQTRDLVYSEYSSCDRSIHLLVQEGPGVPYEFVLRGYRDAVSTYLSSASILPPVEFLGQLLTRFEALCAETQLAVEHWKNAGIHVVLRFVDTAFVLTTAEHEVLLHSKGRLTPVSELGPGEAERLRFQPGELQADLFPRRFRDVVATFKIGMPALSGVDLVVGCAREDRAVVVDGLSGSVWVSASQGREARASRHSIVSRTVSRKILVVRFGHGETDGGRTTTPGKRTPRVRIRASAPRLVVLAAAVVVTVLIGLLWRSERAAPDRVTSAQVSRPEITVRKTQEPLTPPGEGLKADAGHERGIRLTDKWRTRYDKEVTSSPVVLGEAVIVGCRDGHVYALARSTGVPLWKFAATAGVGSSPVVWQGRVIVADYNGNVFALDGRTGEKIWRRKLPARVVSSPDLAGDRVVVGCYDGSAYCVAPEDGDLLWTVKTGARIRGSVTASPDAFFVPSHDGFLYAVSVLTGRVVWRTPLGGPVTASPAAGHGVVVIGGPDGSIHGFDAAGGASVWAVSTGAAVESRALVEGGNALVGSNDGYLYCLGLEDGSVVWKARTGRGVLGRPLVRDGVVYAGSYDGELYAIELSTGRVLDSFDAGAPIYSSPVLDEDHVYFGTNRGEFICLAVHGLGTT